MLIFCLIVAALSVLTACGCIALAVHWKKRFESFRETMLNFVKAECEHMRSEIAEDTDYGIKSAIRDAKDYTDKKMKETDGLFSGKLLGIGKDLEDMRKKYEVSVERVEKLETKMESFGDSLVSDFCKQVSSADFIDEFGQNIARIMSFDPVAEERRRRERIAYGEAE